MIVYHPDYQKHVLSPGHPESPERLEAVVERLKKEDLFNVLSPKKASVEQISKVHALDYINTIKNVGFIDFEAPVHPETFDIASLAAGGTITAAEYAFENKKPVFALVRPPGHHSGRNYGGGFCYFNNAAIGVKNLGKKSAIIDIDLHHGNGTSDIFYEDPDVLYISTHQANIYPGTGRVEETGKGKGEGFNVNIPFPSGCGDKSYDMAFEKIIKPIISQFSPEMIFVSFGGDAHYMDPLGGLSLSSLGYVSLCEKITNLAKNVCDSKLCFVLEGGYNVDALSEIVAGIVGIWHNKKIDYEFTNVNDNFDTGKTIVEKVMDVQKRYWKL
ncbi:MAG: histone deacetylase [Candidatus Thermoplasmatota archaeon]|nr:histone deacetylase [Candidatus Thermoplasmatota archaeon]